MDIIVYNGLSRKREKLIPQKSEIVKFYSCGPTTYDFLHVGNARALVVGDLIYRILMSLGFKVIFVRNFTDVDDKIIERAAKEGVDPLVHSQRFIDECLRDMKSLNLLPPTHSPKVSETMAEIIQMIQVLLDKGFAYVVGGEVLFNVPKFPDYGKLSKKDMEGLQHGIRVDIDEKKKHPSDFVLWKPAKEGEPAWNSPWGKGRPGWHIECSAMAKKFLGDHIDLHHGGIDLMFPHHENEIAQSECANGCTFSNNWVHNEFLNFGSEKMSKSLGNVITIRGFVESFGGEVLRHLLSSVHYRSKMEWSDGVIERALSEIERIHLFAVEIKKLAITDRESDSDILEVAKIKENILKELSNDFNAPGALAELFSMIRLINREYIASSQEGIGQKLKDSVLRVLSLMDKATGLVYENAQEILDKVGHARKKISGADKLSDDKILSLVEERKQARSTKNFKRSDEIRNMLLEAGVEIKDNPDGSTTWSYK
ncbi:MAG: cysteine--tRNA ligase [Bacteriovoracales bacterium]